MPPRDPTFWELVVEAFHRRPASKRMGAVPWNKIALAAVAILGLGNPGFWLAGVAGELIYLYASATSPRFRNLIRAKRLEAERTTGEQQAEKWLSGLSGEGRRRFQALVDNCREVQRVYETLRPGGLSALDEQRRKGLNQLLFDFLRMQVSLDLSQRETGTVSPQDLQREVESLRAELASIPEASEALRRSRQAHLEIMEKRLANLGRAAEERQFFSSELQRIEQQVELLREEAAMSRNAETLSASIDSVTRALSDNESWMRQHEEIFSDLGVAGGPPPQLLEREPPPAETTR